MMNIARFAFIPNIGVTELVVLVIGLSSLAVPVWGIIDAAQRPDSQWKATGVSRATWITLMAVAAFACSPVGLVISIYYLVSMRPRLDGRTAYRPGGVADADLDR